STAGTAAITNQGGNASLVFYDNSRAGTATITNGAGGKVEFYLNATGDNATLTNQAGGTVRFWQNSTGGNAAFTNDGMVSFADSSGPNGDGKLSAGSIAGAGSYILGANELTVGGNGNSTEVSGVISGVGGSLLKTGIGTMILSGINTYTGGTTISAGTLQLGSNSIAGAIRGAVNVGVNGTFDV